MWEGIWRRIRHGATAAVLLVLLVCPPAVAQSYNVLYNFAGGNADGAGPMTSFVSSGSVLYGTTYGGGSRNTGTVFKFDLSTNTETVLHIFSTDEGGNPSNPLLLIGSTLYGTTDYDGTFGRGTLFALDTSGNGFKVLKQFAGGSNDGSEPLNRLTLSGSTIYGMAELGGPSSGGGIYGYGSLFGFDTVHNTFANLHFFTGGTGDGRDPFRNGFYQAGSVLIGMTNQGGVNDLGGNIGGTIFSFNTVTNHITVLHSFVGGSSDGLAPEGSLIGSGPVLYGTTTHGGSADGGTIFAFNTVSNSVTVHTFTGGAADGAMPLGSLIEVGSILYGMTYQGGSSDVGTIFSYDTRTNTFSLLHTFAWTDGARPWGDLMLSGSTLYGTTDYGGSNGDGVIFSLDVPEPASATLMMGAAFFLTGRFCGRARKSGRASIQE